jgi:hypothetical protein
MVLARGQNTDNRKSRSFQQYITGDRNYISVCRPGVSLAIEALNGLIQCAPLTSSMTSLVSNRMRMVHIIHVDRNKGVYMNLTGTVKCLTSTLSYGQICLKNELETLTFCCICGLCGII